MYEGIYLVSAFPIRMRMSTSNSKHGSFLYQKIIKIPTQKGEHSCKCAELSLKRIEEIFIKIQYPSYLL